ncbi:hypothetical protein HA402_000502 [Bradysia odoriphaga]|nr:hypothetical protein HA402_000502 [Bradysia odoriphaga]
MDGASGQSEYKQIFKNCTETVTDSSIMMISLVPLAIRSGSDILWMNNQASSTKYCRPIIFMFAKENKKFVQREYASVQNEIDHLIPSSIDVDGRNSLVHHNLTMTMVDGKLINEINDSSDSNCNIRGATPKQMNDFDLIEKLEWLQLSIVKRGSGNTNDGNTARRFFEDPSFSAKSTGLNRELINRFRVILGAISSGVAVDASKFRVFAKETALLYKKHYDWFYMPPSVHKVLFHGGDIIESLHLPIGIYSEEAQESRNKDFKRIRQNHTRKMSRLETNEDLIHGLLVSSDPYISSMRKDFPKKEKPIDSEIAQLLKLSY